VIVAMAGLPGSGKSALASELARALGCALLSVDPVEAALWRSGVDRDQPTGLAAYVVVDALAAEQLALGASVVVDAVNAEEPAREQWRQLAVRTGVELRFIEVRCPDATEHRRRLEQRQRRLRDFREPTWDDVLARAAGSADWTDDRLVIDSLQDRESNLRTALAYLGRTFGA
jgi:predicted kinase